ncbi:hypothetical protein KCM76_22975 [Zooshikella marina]|uniref:hypothetical protein n=1 Tax=Zooshikella ganghwensis TaxID=202772 RepID=UPI001BAEF25C|nr:hypothetical protein [Zooshikella ganghwensis]MBU2708876.1 hypothetical protein [Zooshikella ganghwensis]
MAATQTKYIPFDGGLDLVSPAMTISGGKLIDCLNYEPGMNGGYRRINGYQRFDGQRSPVERYALCIELDREPPNVQYQAITGAGTGHVIFQDRARIATDITTALQVGSVLSIQSEQYAVKRLLEGLYEVGETIERDKKLETLEAFYRQKITKPHGTGPITGLFYFHNTLYALRGTQLSQSSATGWQQVNTQQIILWYEQGEEFPTDAIEAGAAKAKVLKWVRTSGSNDDKTSKGYCLIQIVEGSFQAGQSLNFGAKVWRVETRQLEQIKHFDHCIHNFYGSQNQEAVYFCTGNGPAYCFNGEYLFPILLENPEEINNPSFIETHNHYLFLGFTSGRVRHSVIAEPTSFNAVLGANEIAIGSNVTGLKSTTGGVLIIGCEKQLFGLFGQTSDQFSLKLIAQNSGAFKDTMQSLGDTYTIDNSGVVAIGRVQAFGDFSDACVSKHVKPILDQLKLHITGSVTVPERGQVRFYSRMGEILIMKPQQYFTYLKYPVEISCFCTGETATGEPVRFFGSPNGYVYKDGVGTNFDGLPIEHFLRFPFNHLGSPSYRKAFKRIELEIDSPGPMKLLVAPEIDYSAPHVESPNTQPFYVYGGGGLWTSSNWDEFLWDSPIVATAALSVSGTGKNISICIHGEDAFTQPFIIQGVHIHYIPRRRDRG